MQIFEESETAKTVDIVNEPNIDEEQAVSEPLAEESRHTVVADEANISDAVTAPEHSMDEPENERVQTSLKIVSEEIQRQTEMFERMPEAESSGAKEVEEEKNLEQKLDSLLKKDDDNKQNIDEEHAVSEALEEESRDKSGHTVMANEDNISDAVIVPEHSKNEPESEKIQTSLEMPSEDLNRTASRELSETITCARADTSIKNQDESFDKLEKEEKSVDNDAVKVDGIQKLEVNSMCLQPFFSSKVLFILH